MTKLAMLGVYSSFGRHLVHIAGICPRFGAFWASKMIEKHRFPVIKHHHSINVKSPWNPTKKSKCWWLLIPKKTPRSLPWPQEMLFMRTVRDMPPGRWSVRKKNWLRAGTSAIVIVNSKKTERWLFTRYSSTFVTVGGFSFGSCYDLMLDGNGILWYCTHYMAGAL